MRVVIAIWLGAMTTVAFAEVALDVFLEQRVADELAVEGTVLSRLGVTLDIESVGDKLIISLVDPMTRRPLASTKIDAVPADREAAVAQVVQVVSSLVTQIGKAPAPASDAVVAEMRRESSVRAAEADYKRDAITVRAALGSDVNGQLEVADTIFHGDRAIDEEEFFELVDRSDLATTYRHRHVGGAFAGVAGGLVGVTGLAVLIGSRADRGTTTIVGAGLLAGGLTAGAIGAYYYLNANPLEPKRWTRSRSATTRRSARRRTRNTGSPSRRCSIRRAAESLQPDVSDRS